MPVLTAITSYFVAKATLSSIVRDLDIRHDSKLLRRADARLAPGSPRLHAVDKVDIECRYKGGNKKKADCTMVSGRFWQTEAVESYEAHAAD